MRADVVVFLLLLVQTAEATKLPTKGDLCGFDLSSGGVRSLQNYRAYLKKKEKRNSDLLREAGVAHLFVRVPRHEVVSKLAAGTMQAESKAIFHDGEPVLENVKIGVITHAQMSDPKFTLDSKLSTPATPYSGGDGYYALLTLDMRVVDELPNLSFFRDLAGRGELPFVDSKVAAETEVFLGTWLEKHSEQLEKLLILIDINKNFPVLKYLDQIWIKETYATALAQQFAQARFRDTQMLAQKIVTKTGTNNGRDFGVQPSPPKPIPPARPQLSVRNSNFDFDLNAHILMTVQLAFGLEGKRVQVELFDRTTFTATFVKIENAGYNQNLVVLMDGVANERPIPLEQVKDIAEF